MPSSPTSFPDVAVSSTAVATIGAACAEAGFLGARGFALERAAAQVCREGGGRESTNVMVKNLDIDGGNRTDARRLEIVVDGFDHLRWRSVGHRHHHGVHCSGTARRRAADHNGATFDDARGGARARTLRRGGPPFHRNAGQPSSAVSSDIFRALLLRRLSLPFDFPLLPVWPSSRLLWPSPCKLCVGRCVGEAGLCIGVCGSTRVS